MSNEDRELVNACASGDSAAWDRFFDQYGRLIGATVGAVLRRQSSWQIEEQEMKSYVHEMLFKDDARRLTKWRGDSKLSTYLVQITRNLCIDYFRQVTRGPRRDANADVERMETEADITKLADGKSFDAQVAALQAAIEALSPKQGMIIKLRLAGVALRDIADRLKIPSGTVFAENSRAMKRLRSLLENQEPFAERGFTM